MLFFWTGGDSDCVQGSTRLVGGNMTSTGRVEVCIDGQWGSICTSTANTPSAVCNSLGFAARGKAIWQIIPNDIYNYII